MGPIMRPYQREVDKLSITTEDHKQELFIDPPEQSCDYIGYAEFLGEVKTAMVMNNWIEELPEEKILERFSVQPGDLYRTIENAKWLLHAIEELAPVVAKNREVPALGMNLSNGFLKALRKN